MLLGRKALLEASQPRQQASGGLSQNADGSQTVRIDSFDSLKAIVRKNGSFLCCDRYHKWNNSKHYCRTSTILNKYYYKT